MAHTPRSCPFRSAFARSLIAAALVTLAFGAACPRPSTTIRVLTDRTQSHLAPILAAYERKAHVKIEVVYLDKGLVSRLERRPVEADLVITKDADLLELARQQGLLQPLASPQIEHAVPPELRDPDGYYFSDSYRARVIFYAHDRVNPTELSTYEDLANPRWKGRICIRSGYDDYNLSLFGQMLAVWGPARTRAFVAGLANNLGRTPSGNDRDQVRAVYEQRCDVAIANSYYMGVMLSIPEQRPWGLATRVFFPDQNDGGTFILRSGLALTKATARVKPATALLEYMVSEEAQDLMARMTYAYPVIRTATPLPELTRSLGAGQPGIQDGKFAIHAVAVPEIARERDAVIRMLDELQFDRPR